MRSKRFLVMSLLTLTVLVLILTVAAVAGAQPASDGSDHAATLAAAVAAAHVPVSAGRAEVVYVYITRTGAKYHRHYCVDDHTHFKKTLSWVKSHGYKPCKVCKPPR